MEKKEYTPKPIPTKDIDIPKELLPLIDGLAKNTHEIWAKGRVKEGWTYGADDGSKKENPNLKPFEEMSAEEQRPDRNTVTETLKLILACGYKIKPKAKESVIDTSGMNAWQAAEAMAYTMRYTDESGSPAKPPIYRAPLVIGLAAQDTAVASRGKATYTALDNFIRYIFAKLHELPQKQSNDERTTPVYLMTVLRNDAERKLAEYANREYGIDIIEAASDDELIRQSALMLAVWDGIDMKAGSVGRVVRDALLESDNKEERAGFAINDVLPVFQIMLPSERLKAIGERFEYKIRPLFPYLLESGKTWFTIEGLTKRSFVATVGKYNVLKLRRSAELKEKEKEYVKDIRVRTKKIRQQLSKNESGADSRAARKAIVKKGRNSIKKIKENGKAFIRYNERIISDAMKGKSLDELICKIRLVNKYVNSDIGVRKGEYNNCLIAAGVKNRAADAVNTRHLRLDVVATKLQSRYRNSTLLLAAFAMLGFAGYGLLTDLAEPYSSLGIIGAALTVIMVIAAICTFAISALKNWRSVYADVRLLAELLRTKTFINAAGMTDIDVGDYLRERQKLNLVWARKVCRGWDAVDKAGGFYELPGDIADPAKVFGAWIGEEDKEDEAGALTNPLKYTPSNKGQMGYVRKSGRRYESFDSWQSGAEGIVPLFAAIAMVLISGVIAVSFFSHAGSMSVFGAKNQIEPGLLLGWLESTLIFIIGIVPPAFACAFLYWSTRRYNETVKRFKWLGTKYQKLVSCMEMAEDDEERRAVLDEAARVSVEEIGEWTELISDSNAKLPF